MSKYSLDRGDTVHSRKGFFGDAAEWHIRTCNDTSHLKIKFLVQYQGASEFQPASLHQYVEDLRDGANAEFGLKDYFEIACKKCGTKPAKA
jgi:hypothetical protein